MAENEGDPIAGESFSNLLFAADDDALSLDTDTYYNYTSSFSPENPPKILCFGDHRNKCDTPHKSGVACRESSTTKTTLSEANKKRNGSGNDTVQSFIAGLGAGDPAGKQKNCKKVKPENSTSAVTGHGKVKREKLGERITALQQLVSPYGKTDTASVLHEAMGYIRFLHDQIQALCSPYMQRLPSSRYLQEEGPRKDLRSRGLCLVPLECTAHVANNDNGADFWSPAAMANKVFPKN